MQPYQDFVFLSCSLVISLHIICVILQNNFTNIVLYVYFALKSKTEGNTGLVNLADLLNALINARLTAIVLLVHLSIYLFIYLCVFLRRG